MSIQAFTAMHTVHQAVSLGLFTFDVALLSIYMHAAAAQFVN